MAEIKTIIDTSDLPANLVISNETEEPIALPIFPDNGELVLQPNTQIVYRVDTSREYLYYYQTSKSLGLTIAEAEKG